MSRWLANVNSLLEKLDGTVEEVIDEQRKDEEDGEEDLDSILAKRGLSDDDGEIQFGDDDAGEKVAHEATQDEDQSEDHSSVVVVEGEESEGSKSTDAESPLEEQSNVVEEFNTEETSHWNDLNDQEASVPDRIEGKQSNEPSETENDQEHAQPFDITNPAEKIFPSKTNFLSKSLTPSQSSVSEADLKQALAESRDSLKEARTLRRHVVSLNKQLETAELELEAQRFELQQAGGRLEKDRKKYKEEKEKLTSKQLEDVKALKKQHDLLLADIKLQYQEELQKVQIQLKSAEEQRMQEGGDMTAELQNVIIREQELLRKVALMDDEKVTLLDHIGSLQDQQDRVQSRLDSISQTADNAIMREREAEEKLDMALTLHARQIAQRQARETELERMIADLSSSLANSSSMSNEGDSAAGAESVTALKAQLYSLEEDLETCKTRLESERQRVLIMQQELRDMSKERTLEVTAHRSKQHQFDRQVAELSLQISKLQANLREAQRGSLASLEKSSGGVDASTHVMELSHELVRNQERMGQIGSELSTLRNKLQTAIARAEKAESALASLGSNDIENGPESGNYHVGGAGMRRRKKDITSIRDAINLQNSHNESIERVGKVIDGLDKFAVDTGKFLRHNPLARGGFILYLVVLHLWTFTVLFFHTHRFETVHGDFGAGRQVALGPHALMQNHIPDLVPSSQVVQKTTVVAVKPVEVFATTEKVENPGGEAVPQDIASDTGGTSA